VLLQLYRYYTKIIIIIRTIVKIYKIDLLIFNFFYLIRIDFSTMTNQSTINADRKRIIRKKIIRKEPFVEKKVELNEPKKRVIRKKLVRKTKEPTTNTQTNDNQQKQTLKETIDKPKIKKKLIRKPKVEPNQTPINNIKIDSNSNKSVYDATTEEENDDVHKDGDSLSDDDLEEVLVINWKCSHYGKDYLLDPITHEVYCKKTRDLLGFRYKNEDELSLIDFN